MLTADENMVDINIAVQYRRANALDYAFNVRKPEDTLNEVSESAIREVIGRSKLDAMLESGRLEIVASTQELMQRTLDAYKVGLEVTAVNLQDVQVPEEVRRRSRMRSRRARIATACRWRRRPTRTTSSRAHAVTPRARCRKRRPTSRARSRTPTARPSASPSC